MVTVWLASSRCPQNDFSATFTCVNGTGEIGYPADAGCCFLAAEAGSIMAIASDKMMSFFILMLFLEMIDNGKFP
jgi:hypothetical protein